LFCFCVHSLSVAGAAKPPPKESDADSPTRDAKYAGGGAITDPQIVGAMRTAVEAEGVRAAENKGGEAPLPRYRCAMSRP